MNGFANNGRVAGARNDSNNANPGANVGAAAGEKWLWPWPPPSANARSDDVCVETIDADLNSDGYRSSDEENGSEDSDNDSGTNSDYDQGYNRSNVRGGDRNNTRIPGPYDLEILSRSRKSRRCMRLSDIANRVARIDATSMDYPIAEPWRATALGSEEGRGSGWFIDLPEVTAKKPGTWWLVTCFHCVAGTLKNGGLYVRTGVTGSRRIPARVVAVMVDIDAALLQVEASTDAPFSGWRLGDDKLLRTNERVRVYGYPGGQSNLKVVRSTINGRQDGALQIDGAVNHGHSGGPVVHSGRVVGWVSEGVVGSNSIVYAKPITYLCAVLRSLIEIALRPDPPVGTRAPPVPVLRAASLGIDLAMATRSAIYLAHAILMTQAQAASFSTSSPSSNGFRPNRQRFGPAASVAPHIAADAANDAGGYGFNPNLPTGTVSIGKDGGNSNNNNNNNNNYHNNSNSNSDGDNNDEAGDSGSGALVRWISRESPLYNDAGVRSGDIIEAVSISVAGPTGIAHPWRFAIDRDGGVSVPWAAAERARLVDILSMAMVGSTAMVEILHAPVLRYADPTEPVPASYHRTVRIELLDDLLMGGLRSMYPPFERPDFEAFAGLVVCEINAQLAQSVDQLANLPTAVLEQPAIVIVQVLPGSALSKADDTDGGAVRASVVSGDIILRVNGVPVTNINEYRRALTVPVAGQFLLFEIRDEFRATIAMELVAAEEPGLASSFGYPSSATARALVGRYAPRGAQGNAARRFAGVKEQPRNEYDAQVARTIRGTK